MKTSLIVILVIAIHLGIAWFVNLPKNVGLDVPDGKLNSLSFAPFHEGQSPLQGIFPSAAQVETDLKLLSDKTHTIRTYAAQESKETPELAGKYGLKLLQGAWLGVIPENNILEVIKVIQLANNHPDVIKRVIVGNEVLLRGDLTADELIHYIRLVKQRVKQPVSYADVWSMYMKYPQLMKEVDFITIHILPYWEDEPIPVENAPQHIERVYRQVQREAAALGINKPILIGESGWPSSGRQRGFAVPNVTNAAQFIRGLIHIANANGFDVNIVEAINQPWKSELEGVVGANWGLLSVNRKQVFPLTGLVYENPNWQYEHGLALLLFLIAAIGTRKALKNLSGTEKLVFLTMLQLLLVVWIQQISTLWYTSYDDWQRLQNLVFISLNMTLAGLLLKRCYTIFTERTASPRFNRYLLMLVAVFYGYAFYKTFTLANHGRYISFPVAEIALLIAGLVSLMAAYMVKFGFKQFNSFSIQGLLGGSGYSSFQNKLVGYALLINGGYLIVGETLDFFYGNDMVLAYPDELERFSKALLFTLGNLQLVTWLLFLILLAILLLHNSYIVESNKQNG